MTQKTLVVGDIHTHYDILEQVKTLAENYDKAIFLGDYVDDWNAIPEASYNTLNELINFKKTNPDKVILLLGNHDLSEWQAGDFRCSGYNENTHALIKPLLDKNEELFDIAYTQDNFLFTHAGLTVDWWNKYCGDVILPPDEESRILLFTNTLNSALHNRDKDETAQNIFHGLSEAGRVRGGSGIPSPIWTDVIELVSDEIRTPQIVGHTPYGTVTKYDLFNRNLYFCDTFSTTQEGEYIGDCSLLVIEDGETGKIGLDGKPLPW